MMKANPMTHVLTLLALLPATGLLAGQPDFQSQHLAVGLSRGAPAFSLFAVDSLGQGKLDQNPVLAEANAVPGLRLEERFTYTLNGKPIWRVECGETDGSDGFQFYQNGGATGCWAYYTVKALYQLGRAQDARRIFHPVLSGYAAGKFQGFDPKSGPSVDWRDWQGGGHGYEGLLVDNYHALLAVLEDVEAKKP